MPVDPNRDDSDFIAFFAARTRTLELGFTKPLLQREPTTGEFSFEILLQQNTTPAGPFELLFVSPDDVTVNGGVIEVHFSTPADRMFYKLRGAE